MEEAEDIITVEATQSSPKSVEVPKKATKKNSSSSREIDWDKKKRELLHPKKVSNSGFKKGPYRSYDKEQVAQLLSNYFIFRNTVLDSCKLVGMKKSSGYRYVKMIKSSNFPKVFYEGSESFQPEQLKEFLREQTKALNLL